MRSRAYQSKFMRVVTTPVRVLCKARDVYVRTLTNYSTRMVYGQSKALPAAGQYSSALLRSLSAAPSRSNESEDYRELLRAASVRTLGNISELDMYARRSRQQQLLMVEPSNNSSKVLPKSCSVGMGFMGRIDEEKEYEEVSEGLQEELHPISYPRSRSYVAGKRN